MKNTKKAGQASRGPRMYFRLTQEELDRVQSFAALSKRSPTEFVKAAALRDAPPLTTEYEHVIMLLVDFIDGYKSLSKKVDAGAAQAAKLEQGVASVHVQAKRAVDNQIIMDQKADRAAKRIEDAFDKLEILVASGIPGGMTFREAARKDS